MSDWASTDNHAPALRKPMLQVTEPDAGWPKATPSSQAQGSLQYPPPAGDGWASTKDHAPDNKRTWMDSASDFAQGAWEGVGGQTVIDLIGGASRDPARSQKSLDTLKGLVQGFANEPARVGNELVETAKSLPKAFMTADYGPTMSHLAQSVPLFGAGAGQVQHDFENGDYAKGFGHAFGMLAPLLGPEVAAKIKVNAGPLIKNTLNPVARASQDFLDAEGIQTPVSMQTGSKVAANLEGLVRNEIGGADFAERAAAQTRGDVNRLVQRKLDDISPTKLTPVEAGGKVIGKIKRDIRDLDLKADNHYSQAWRVENDPVNIKQVPVEREANGKWQAVLDDEGNLTYEDMVLPVEMSDIQAELRPIAAQYARTLSDTDARASLGLKTMREIINGPTWKPVRQLELDLGLLKKAARTEKGLAELRTGSQGMAANSVRLVQEAVDSVVGGAKGGQDALQNLQNARGATQQKWSLYDQARKFGNPNLEELEGGTVYNKLTGDKDVRIQFLRRIRAIAPDQMPAVGRAFAENLFDRITREGDLGHVTQALNEWDNLGRESKLVLLGSPELVSDWNNLFVSLKRLAKEVNPSGSGYLTALSRTKNAVTTGLGMAGGLSGHAAAGGAGAAGGGALGVLAGLGLDMLSNGALARLLYDPKWTKLLTRGINFRLAGKPNAAAFTGAQLLRMAQPVINEEKQQETRPPLSNFHRP